MISSAAVLRKEKILRLLLSKAKRFNYSGKKIYEALLQSYLFAGYPSALISLKIFSEYYTPPAFIYDKGSNQNRVNGKKIAAKIYGSSIQKLKSNIKSFSPELADWFITEGYGKVLNRPFLNLKSRELSNIAILVSLKFEEQLYSHINGAYSVGVKPEQIYSLITKIAFVAGKTRFKFGIKVFKNFILRKGLKFNFPTGN